MLQNNKNSVKIISLDMYNIPSILSSDWLVNRSTAEGPVNINGLGKKLGSIQILYCITSFFSTLVFNQCITLK